MRDISLVPKLHQLEDSKEIRLLLMELVASLTATAPPDAATAGDTYTATEKAMLQNVHDVLTALINALRE